MTMSWTETVRHAGDHVMPHGFERDPDTGELPPGTTWIGYGHVSAPCRVQDAHGERFWILAHGPMQGTVVMRDRRGRVFYADSDIIMREVNG